MNAPLDAEQFRRTFPRALRQGGHDQAISDTDPAPGAMRATLARWARRYPILATLGAVVLVVVWSGPVLASDQRVGAGVFALVMSLVGVGFVAYYSYAQHALELFDDGLERYATERGLALRRDGAAPESAPFADASTTAWWRMDGPIGGVDATLYMLRGTHDSPTRDHARQKFTLAAVHLDARDMGNDGTVRIEPAARFHSGVHRTRGTAATDPEGAFESRFRSSGDVDAPPQLRRVVGAVDVPLQVHVDESGLHVAARVDRTHVGLDNLCHVATRAREAMSRNPHGATDAT